MEKINEQNKSKNKFNKHFCGADGLYLKIQKSRKNTLLINNNKNKINGR